MSVVGLVLVAASVALPASSAQPPVRGAQGTHEPGHAAPDVNRGHNASGDTVDSQNLRGALSGGQLQLQLQDVKVAQVGDVLGGGSVKKKAGEEDGEAAQELNPMRGSSVIYRNAVTAVSFNPNGADVPLPGGQTAAGQYDPVYIMTLRLLPTWWFNEYVGLWGDAWFGGELTHSNWTNQQFYMITDPTLGVRGAYTIPVVNIGLSGNLALNFPAAPRSVATSKYIGITGDLSASYAMPFLPALRVGLGVGGQKDFHEYTTAGTASQLECPAVVQDFRQCTGRMVAGQFYNADYSIWLSSFIGYGITDWLSVATSFLYIHSQRYASSSTSHLISATLENATNSDPILYWNLGVTATPHPMVSVRLGLQSIHHALRADGKLQAPLFNRFTQIFVDLIFNAGQLYTLFADMGDQA